MCQEIYAENKFIKKGNSYNKATMLFFTTSLAQLEKGDPKVPLTIKRKH